MEALKDAGIIIQPRAYGDLMPVGDKLLGIVATKTGQEPIGVLRELQKGMFSGDMKALRTVMSVLGPELGREFVHLSPDDKKQLASFSGHLAML